MSELLGPGEDREEHENLRYLRILYESLGADYEPFTPATRRMAAGYTYPEALGAGGVAPGEPTRHSLDQVVLEQNLAMWFEQIRASMMEHRPAYAEGENDEASQDGVSVYAAGLDADVFSSAEMDFLLGLRGAIARQPSADEPELVRDARDTASYIEGEQEGRCRAAQLRVMRLAHERMAVLMGVDVDDLPGEN